MAERVTAGLVQAMHGLARRGAVGQGEVQLNSLNLVWRGRAGHSASPGDAWPGGSGRRREGPGLARRCEAGFILNSFGLTMAGRGEARRGAAGRVPARPGWAWRGQNLNLFHFSMAMRGRASPGYAWHGESRSNLNSFSFPWVRQGSA